MHWLALGPNSPAPPDLHTGVTPEPKELGDESLHWFESAPGDPNEKEMLLYAMLVVYTRTSVADLNKWVCDVLWFQAPYISVGASGLPASWRPAGSKVPEIYEPLGIKDVVRLRS